MSILGSTLFVSVFCSCLRHLASSQPPKVKLPHRQRSVWTWGTQTCHPVVYHHIAINVPNMVHPPFSGIYTQNWFCNLLIISYPPLYHHFPPFNPNFHGKTTLNHHISCIYPHVIPIYRSFSHDIFLINPLLWPKTRFSKAKDVLGCSADVAWLTAVVGSLLRLFPSEQRVALILKCACRRLDWGACVRLADRGLEDDLW